MEKGVITELDHSGTKHTAWYLSVIRYPSSDGYLIMISIFQWIWVYKIVSLTAIEFQDEMPIAEELSLVNK